MKIRKAERIQPTTIRVRGEARAIRRRSAADGERHASGGRGEARPGHVHEHGAAASGDPRPGVVIQFDDKIVEMIGALEPVAGLLRRQAGSAGCNGGRAGPRTSRRRPGCAAPAAASLAAPRGRRATTAAAAGTCRAACRRRPRACWPGCRRGRARPEGRAARPAASRGCAGPALHAPRIVLSVTLRMGCKALALLARMLSPNALLRAKPPGYGHITPWGTRNHDAQQPQDPDRRR